MLDPTSHLLRTVFQAQVDAKPRVHFARYVSKADEQRFRLANAYKPREPTRDGFEVDIDV